MGVMVSLSPPRRRRGGFNLRRSPRGALIGGPRGRLGGAALRRAETRASVGHGDCGVGFGSALQLGGERVYLGDEGLRLVVDQ